MTQEEHGIVLPDGEELVVLEDADRPSPAPALDPRAEWLRWREVAGAPPADPAR